LNHASAVPVIPSFSSFLRRILCGTTSKAFLRSRVVVPVCQLGIDFWAP
jgi:hypothetical protein